MHLIIAILGGLVTILYLLHRLKGLGLDIGWLNPFHWYHRQKWRSKVSVDPVFSLENPVEVAAGLLYTVAKLSGDISAEQKALLLEIFEKDFKLNSQDATHLLSSNAFLIKDEDKVSENLDKFLQGSKEQFTEAQIKSTLELVDRIIAVEERVSHKQEVFREKLHKRFARPNEGSATW